MAENADLLALLAEMKKSMEKGQEEMRKGQEEMRKGQEEMRKGQEDMKDEMRKGQEEMKDEMRKGQEEMKNEIQTHVESKVGEIKDHVNSCIDKIEEDVQSVRREIGEMLPVGKLSMLMQELVVNNSNKIEHGNCDVTHELNALRNTDNNLEYVETDFRHYPCLTRVVEYICVSIYNKKHDVIIHGRAAMLISHADMKTKQLLLTLTEIQDGSIKGLL
ncbi:hypothetical protein AVEN_243782-1 [Araneus ventricosus]|uniref:Uncharacterized protein n=1 Tax=Araneus ventricosus TaxID=182803 RepID=A0A4Y2A5H0_ARAVE|nr:hypothetical protein AVEN_243782-1 [Araneus ventricosus]